MHISKQNFSILNNSKHYQSSNYDSLQQLANISNAKIKNASKIKIGGQYQELDEQDYLNI